MGVSGVKEFSLFSRFIIRAGGNSKHEFMAILLQKILPQNRRNNKPFEDDSLLQPIRV